MSGDEKIEAFQKAMEEAREWPTRDPVDQAEHDRSSAGAFPGGPLPEGEDWVLHPDFGRCQVRTVEPPLVHLVDETGRKIELSLETTRFTPDSIESGQLRVFTMSPRPLA